MTTTFQLPSAFASRLETCRVRYRNFGLHQILQKGPLKRHELKLKHNSSKFHEFIALDLKGQD